MYERVLLGFGIDKNKPPPLAEDVGLHGIDWNGTTGERSRTEGNTS